MKKKAMFGWIVGALVVVGGAATAAALVITATGISAGSTNVGGCDSSITLGFGTPSFSTQSGDYVITQVSYSGVDTTACNGMTLYVTLADNQNAVITQGQTSSAFQTGDPSSGTITLLGEAPVSSAVKIAAAIS